MGNLSFYDAADPPADPPATDGVCIYIGGDTPHIWTMAEINAQRARYRLPVWVRSDPAVASVAADVARAVAQLKAIGAPAGCLVALDSETAADPGYVKTFYGLLHLAGYPLIDYGSQDTVFGNENPDGYYWGADWTGTPHIASGDQMTQYVSFTGYDESLAKPTLPFWDTAPDTAPPWQENAMQKLPELAQGAMGPAVRTAQALCGARGHQLTVDGIYGPLTKSAVEAVQQSAGIGVDGITGPQTWPVLLGVG